MHWLCSQKIFLSRVANGGGRNERVLKTFGVQLRWGIRLRRLQVGGSVVSSPGRATNKDDFGSGFQELLWTVLGVLHAFTLVY